MLRILIALSVVATITFSCNSQKKNQTSPSSEIVAASSTPQTDTTKELVKKEIYRASNPRSNDIIHTKLEVNFDWQKSRMNGKATIQLKPYFYPTQMLYLDARGMEI